MILRDWLREQPFGLAMSSGFFSFFAHTGFLDALLGAGHVPVHVAGSSAGALVGGAWASGVSTAELEATFRSLKRADFWDPTLGAGLLAGKKFDALLRRLLPVAAIESCAIPTKISVFEIASRTTRVIERGDLPDAIRASCCVPIMFHPVTIEGRAYWDGGILDRPGIAGIPDGKRLLFHHIASKSPWRAVLPIPKRSNMVSIVIEGLPRSGPWKLDAGRRALELAREATRRALDAEIIDGVVTCVI